MYVYRYVYVCIYICVWLVAQFMSIGAASLFAIRVRRRCARGTHPCGARAVGMHMHMHLRCLLLYTQVVRQLIDEIKQRGTKVVQSYSSLHTAHNRQPL